MYIQRDTKKEECQTINFCSYPHERKIFLKKHDEFCKYFYTQTKTELQDEIEFYKHLEDKFKLEKNTWITQQYYDYDAQYYLSVKDKLKSRVAWRDEELPTKSFTSIIAINLTDYKYNVFS